MRNVILIFVPWLAIEATILAAGGSFTLSVQDESTDRPTISRLEIHRSDAPHKTIPIRLTVPAGIGVVLDRKVELELPDSTYQFRMIRGPEYRIVSGNFTLERTSLDSKSVQLPRMVDMLAAGWTSGDCCVVASPHSLPLRMAAEDLHVAAVLGHADAKPIPRRDPDDAIENDPTWIREDVLHHDGLVVYGAGESILGQRLPSQWIADLAQDAAIKVAIENPFAWPLPVWLASERIDGFFLLGDWLRLDRKVLQPKEGRGPVGPSLGSDTELGQWGLTIYRHMLESGLRIAPLAGSGNDSGKTPVGYNRLYVAKSPADSTRNSVAVSSVQQWWQAAWDGQSVATNGPMLQPTLEGQLPGHVFPATGGEVLSLHPELTLSVRDRVDYLDVIHNGSIHYTARLDEFAKAGGRIPPLQIKQSSWVMIRVVTLHEDHLRLAISAPWHIDFDGQCRVTTAGVKFFQDWLGDYEDRLKKLSPTDLNRHAPFIRQARAFWKARAEQAESLRTAQ